MASVLLRISRWMSGAQLFHVSFPPRMLRDHGSAVRIPFEQRDKDEATALLPTTVLAWAGILFFALLDLVATRRAGLSFVGYGAAGAPLLLAAAVGVYGVIRGIDRLADLGLFVGLWLLFGGLISILSYCVATAGWPLADPNLVRFDRLVGLNWSAGFNFIRDHAMLRLPLSHAYNSFLPQVFCSVLYFAHTRRRTRNEELFLTAALAGLVTVLVSGLVPAVGPYEKGAMPGWSRMLLALRGGAMGPFSVATLEGIVCTPSYHTVLAILFVYSHRPPSRSFWPVLLLNVVMLVAIPFAGHHYLIDVMSGAVLAVTAIFVVNKIFAALGVQSSALDRLDYQPVSEGHESGAHRPIVISAGLHSNREMVRE